MKLLYRLLLISMMSMVYAECENIDNQIDCEALETCEWHADEMACEDAGHDDDHDDHAHCEDFTDEESCEASDECEWHADEMACEDAGHDDDHGDHEHCDEITDQDECEASEHCEWHGDHCEDEHGHDDGDCSETDHFDTDGLALEHDGEEIYFQFQGSIEGSVDMNINEMLDLSVHFLDNNGNEVEIDESLLDCYPLSFNITDPSVISIEMEDHDDHGDDDHDDDHGDDDHDGHVGGHTFEITGLSVGTTTFTISIMHQGHADYTSLPILVNIGEDCLSGDVNEDQVLNVIDVVQLVQAIVTANTDNISCGDFNNDTEIDILDVVALVQFIVNPRTVDATEATLNINSSDVTIDAEGYIGAVQMILSHGNDFSIELTDKAYVVDYNTESNQTILVVVAPESNELFTYKGDFEVLDYIVANSSSEVSTTISEITFNLGAAYPNPFNPTTSLSLTLPASGYVNVSVYNIVGQQMAELANGNMEAGIYNLTWNASNASSGMYLVRAEYSGSIVTQKLMLLK